MTVPRVTSGAVDDWLEIEPGYVVVDLTRADPFVITPADLQEAFDESDAQLELAETPLDEVLGDIDISPL